MNICENCGWYYSANNWCFLSEGPADAVVMYCLSKAKKTDYLTRDEVLDTCKFYREDPDGVEHIISDFEEAAAEDCRPVFHAEWTAEGNDEYGNYWDRCSACQKSVFFPPSVKNDYKYCPHCGAVMDA